mgnify:CR=1 FL=1
MFFKVATCQFPVNARIRRNGSYMARLIKFAANLGANIVHFPEGSLSGYAGAHFKTWDDFDWDLLVEESERMLQLARDHAIWIIFGSAHRLSEGHLPHNSIYVISPEGKVVERYDKRFCTNQDLAYYTPGDHLALFEIDGIRCGILICHDIRYPELTRKYYQEGVRCIFCSFYNARTEGPKEHTFIIPATLQARAADNFMWLSASNASDSYQLWPSLFITPEGRVVQRLRRHRTGLMVNAVDTEQEFPDKCSFKDLAIRGVLHSGTVVRDPRSRGRNIF